MTHLIWPSSIPDPSALTLIWASVSGTCFTHAIMFTLSNLLLLRVFLFGKNPHFNFFPNCRFYKKVRFPFFMRIGLYFYSLFLTMSSTTNGSASVLVYPSSFTRLAATFFRILLMILPLRVLGRPSAH